MPGKQVLAVNDSESEDGTVNPSRSSLILVLVVCCIESEDETVNFKSEQLWILRVMRNVESEDVTVNLMQTTCITSQASKS